MSDDLTDHFGGPGTTFDEEDYAAKIAGLLRKAENPAISDTEAQLFVSKAQALMTKYAISEALVEAAKTGKEAEEIVNETITYTGVYSKALWDIGAAIGRANGCRVLIAKLRKSTVLTIIGFKSDVDRVRMFDASVQIQAAGGLIKYWAGVDSSWMSPMQKYKARREYLFGFARGLSSQLHQARREGEQEAQIADIAAGGAADSVALVVRSRKQRVDEWVDETYGKLRTVSNNYSYGGYDASAAGHTAGAHANVSSSTQVAGKTRELGS